MDLTLSAEEEAFRDELRGWLDANHPGREPEGDEAGFEFRRAWQKALYDAGWAGLSWPREYGGRGATLVEQAVRGLPVTVVCADGRAAADGLAGGFDRVLVDAPYRAGLAAAPARAARRRCSARWRPSATRR